MHEAIAEAIEYPTPTGPMTEEPSRTAFETSITHDHEIGLQDRSTGLLPQLIEVLDALTEGMNLLSGKLREVLLEVSRGTDRGIRTLESVQTWVSGADLHSVGEDDEAALTEVDGAEVDGEHSLWTDRFDPERGMAPVFAVPDHGAPIGDGAVNLYDGPLTPTYSDPLPALASQPSSDMQFESPHFRVPEHTVSSGVIDAQSQLESEPIGSERMAKQSSTRDYNFFDELDAKLAKLQSPDPPQATRIEDV